MASGEKRCENCEFYNSKSLVWDTGECRFNAPVPSIKPAMMSDKFYSGSSLNWPPVQPNDWCGQYENKGEG